MSCNCEETWKEFIGGKNNNRKYKISSKGQVISFNKNGNGKLLKPTLNNSGYQINYLDLIHRLVCKYFINNGKDFKDLEVDHIDTDRLHNCICNLRICTHKENSNNPLTKIKMKGNTNGKGNLGKTQCCLICEKEISINNMKQHQDGKKCVKKIT